MNQANNLQSNTHLTFFLDGDLFGLNIQVVREVLEYTPITRVPMTADFMRGVINVRGHVVPVIDLRKKFGLAEGQRTAETCIIIVELEADGETATMGALVDGVREVLDIPPDRIEAAPRLGSRIDTRFINGIGKLAEGFVILLDIQAIFSDRELSMIADIQQTEQQGAE